MGELNKNDPRRISNDLRDRLPLDIYGSCCSVTTTKPMMMMMIEYNEITMRCNVVRLERYIQSIKITADMEI